MGRRHLSRAAALAATAFLLVVPDAPAAAVPWRLVASGAATGASITGMQARLALTRSATASFAGTLTPAAKARLAAVDFGTSGIVGVFGPFGCRDARVSVSRVDRTGSTVVVHLVERPLPPGTVECVAIFETFRLLAVPKTSLGRPSPTRARVTLLARA